MNLHVPGGGILSLARAPDAHQGRQAVGPLLPGYHSTDVFSFHAKLCSMVCFEQLKYEFVTEE